MKNALVIVPLAVLTTGCSHLVYPGLGRPMRAPYPAARATPSAAPPIGRWDNVMRLPSMSTIDVLTADGVPTIGSIVGATAHDVTLRSDGVDVTVDRRNIVRVDLVDLPGSEVGAVAKRAARGAAVGAAAATVIAAVIGGPAWPPPGPLVRAGVAAGGASGLQAGMAMRQRRILYVAPEQRTLPPPSWQPPSDDVRNPALLPDGYALPACTSRPAVGSVRTVAPSQTMQSPAGRRAQ